MDTNEMLDKVIALNDSVLSLKAVSTSFFREYVEGTEKDNITAVIASHGTYLYLFKVLLDLLLDVEKKTAALATDLKGGR